MRYQLDLTVLLALLLSVESVSSAQVERSEMSVAGQALSLGMGKRDALQRFSTCCKVTPLGSDAVIVQNRKNSSDELGGMVYFQRDKVVGISADRDWSPDADSYKTALAFYRLVEKSSKDARSKATIYAYSLDGSNGEAKFVVVVFDDGRRVRLEIQNPDPGPNRHQQVAVSECIGNCSDW